MKWKRKIPQLLCEMQKFLHSTFFNAQEHYLIHLVEQIELCGLVPTRSMWKELEIFEGLGSIESTSRGFHGRGIYGLPDHGVH